MRFVQYVIFAILLAILLLLICLVGYDCIVYLFPKNRPLTWNFPVYQWTGVGIVVFWLLHFFFNKNLKWFATFSHELTHTAVSLLFFRKIHSFQAGRGMGEIYTSGNNNTLVFVDLAPYCLPIITYMLLGFRIMILKDMLMYYDILIGFSIGFHFYCFKTQIGSHQTDINKHPLFFSYLYIATFLLFNLTVILVSYWHSKNVFTAFWFVALSIWEHGKNIIEILLS